MSTNGGFAHNTLFLRRHSSPQSSLQALPADPISFYREQNRLTNRFSRLANKSKRTGPASARTWSRTC